MWLQTVEEHISHTSETLHPSPLSPLWHCVLWVPSSPVYLISGPKAQGAQLVCQHPSTAGMTLSLQQTLIL